MKKFLSFILLYFISQTVFANQNITVVLDWFLNPSHAPLFVAQEEGFFKKYNLDVNLISPADPSDPPKLVAAGKADIAISYEPQFIEQIDAHLPLKMLGVLIDKPLNCLVVLKNSGINKISDLKNKRVGYSGTGLNNVALNVMLQHNGLQPGDVEAINIHYNLSQALLTKKVDAATGLMRTFEIFQLELAGQPVRVFFPEQNGMPVYSELVFEVNKDKISDPKFAKFLQAIKEAQNYLQQHPSEMWVKFAKLHPELNNELNKKAWFASLAYFAKDPAFIDKEKIMQFAEFMQKKGLIKNEK